MKKIIFVTLLAASVLIGAKAEISTGYPINGVPFTSVTVNDAFWKQRLQASRDVTIPLAFSKCEESGRYENFVRAAHPCDTFSVTGFSFDDTDVYKTIEGASYLLRTFPDPALEAYIDSVLTIVAGAVEDDGYLYTARTMNPARPHDWSGPERWSKVEELSHEFYNLGHLIDGAVAHYQATGKRNFLDLAIGYADCVCRAIGPDPGQLDRVPGHQIAEMALARLYLATGERKYLDQAKYFLDRRGHTSRRDAYSQAHKPVVEQDEAVGHAVRAAYMYSGMADVAALTGDSAYIHAVDTIWGNIVNRKMYITGGIGSTADGEAFGPDYDLPNLTSYCETCAAIGHVYVNHRLFMLHGDAKYYDVLERTLYNGVISGVSIDGGKFFYPNPLASDGRHERQAWFGCACCPSNISRFIPSLPGYIYATSGKDVYVNLYAANSVSIDVGGNAVKLTQTGGYPWSGDVGITVDASDAGRWAMKLRIPGWAQNRPAPGTLYSYDDGVHPGYTVAVNGEPVEATPDRGYVTIERDWQAGDRVSLDFDMQPRLVKAHDSVEADRGRRAVERGPIVYCAEWADNPGVDFDSIRLVKGAAMECRMQPELLGGVMTISADVATTSADGLKLKLIPYYSWCHRGPGNMAVWLPVE